MLKKVLSIIVIMVMVVSYGDLHVRAKETINVVRYMNNGYVAKGYWLVYGTLQVTNDPYLDKKIYGEAWFTDSKGHSKNNTIQRYYTTFREREYSENLDTMSWRIFTSKQFRISSFSDSHNCNQSAHGSISYQGIK
ncbi:unknown [Clostridium sp. CAG:62]|jgi:hypothetical protein|nr:unknown [Clostridium sp. CAG:62]